MCEKIFRAHTLVPERRTASWPSKHTSRLLTLFSIPFTATAVATAYACSLQSSLSLSLLSLSRIQWNHKKRVKETKITIHHRTKKKNKGFLTNNNDRYVTNMNSFFSLSLASFCSYLYSIISAF